ncbi:hemerythrin domain-containing protein [Solemya pervernicosa gill symbiont]|uniref:hemerythrin domain-containing protein n=1 Tax=Solemya pervernicosa gill symbiont TaxID=642797 RepID=UPI002E8E4CA2|nr:hemerythrin domain-containing protein [Solemya pervernicosa gill symbiont]
MLGLGCPKQTLAKIATPLQCSLLLNELMEVAKEHFRNEEAYLAKVKYPDLAEHAIYHNEMLLKAFQVKQICEGFEEAHDVNACFDELVKFLIDDVLMGDLKFKSYLEYEGYINRYH